MSAMAQVHVGGDDKKTGVFSHPNDKAKIFGHAAMMAIQNFGFFNMYSSIWASTPRNDTCDSTRYATGMMACTCFCVAFLCVGMGMGGITDDKKAFTVFWFAHLVGGSMYTASTVIIPVALWSTAGEACAALDPAFGDRAKTVYIMHAALYLVYVGGMLSITYFSFLKHFWPKLPPAYVILAAAVVFGIPQAVVYAITL